MQRATPRNEDDLIIPARHGTLGPENGTGFKSQTRHEQLPLFDEKHWSVLNGKISVPAYHKSKTLAEESAWKFWREEGGNLELAVINPTGIFGPVMSSNFSSSFQIIKNMMNGNMSGCPQVS
ncbi:hypothetical protein VI817_002427 [Penicillium citrinum]|nr:hypothetical protein VI817_002427 [Penicillium citrinum]